MGLTLEEIEQILDSGDIICMYCVEDTLNNPEVCDTCPVRKLCSSIDYPDLD